MNQNENSLRSEESLHEGEAFVDDGSACGKKEPRRPDTARDEEAVARVIDAAAKKVVVPESLRPEAVGKMLARVQAEEQSAPVYSKRERHGVPGGRKSALITGIAACLVVLAGIGIFVGQALFSGNTGASGGSAPIGADEPVERSIAAAESYDQVQECLATYAQAQDYSNGLLADGGVIMLAEDMDAAQRSSSASSAGDVTTSAQGTESTSASSATAGDHSETNVRTEGVDEADIVKTDGTYIYALQKNAAEIAVVDVQGDDMKKVGTISSQSLGSVSEFYVRDGRVYVLSDASSAVAYDLDDYDYYYGRTDVLLETFDVSDVANPRLLGSVSQSGNYRSSRLVGDYLYLFSNYYVPFSDDMEPVRYIPSVGGEMMACDDIYLPPVRSANQYLVVSSVNVNDPSQVVDQKAVLTDADDMYVSTENIYVYESRWSTMWRSNDASEPSRTTVRKIAYRDGQLEGIAQTKVDGTLNDSFSIDEHKGMLRLVTTVDTWDEKSRKNVTTNSVYVLDESLDVTGSIEGLAEDERVRSARFFGDTGYFVTFRKTDPLFSVDFSDPANPRIIGSLKIPGFSEYLHPYGEGKLLGIGMDADEKTGVTSGMKVSMFDISDPTNVEEEATYLIKKAYHSDVFDDYRAVFVSAERNLIGFSGYTSNANHEIYYVFSYDDATGFTQLMAEDVNGTSWTGTRGLYIGDTLYVVNGNALESYRIGTFEKLDDLLL